MSQKLRPRILSHQEANEEDFMYAVNLTPLKRLQLLYKLRILNYGEKATAPMSKKIQLIKKDD